MSDENLASLAQAAGVSPSWTDQKGQTRDVSLDSLREILAALGLPAGSPGEIAESLARAGEEAHAPLVTARVGEPSALAGAHKSFELTLENGERRVIAPSAPGLLPALDTPGYHVAHLPGGDVTIAVAPRACVTFEDLKTGAGFGLASQIYALRCAGDGGIGHFGGVAAFGEASARLGADCLALSPSHALFGAAPERYSPYSPSTRFFANPLYADPGLIFSPEIFSRGVEASGLGAELARLESLALIDWPASAAAKTALFRALFDLLPQTPQAAEFAAYAQAASPLLRDHALFEVLHGHFWREAKIWSWRDWPTALRTPAGAENFARENQREVEFQLFQQWLVARSAEIAQQKCRAAGMKVGLIADLAIGLDADGSHAWSRPADLLCDLSIGAPPDYYSVEGQNWALAGFSPRALRASGFAPFIETLRAAFRSAGGLRIDHVMGMTRLWMIPRGRGALEGAYVRLPEADLYRLIALESWRHRAMVIGEDLGTLPHGYRDFLGQQGIYGLRVLRFERGEETYIAPPYYSRAAAALTTTHDMIATAGWWKGADVETLDAAESRDWERGVLWDAFTREHCAVGPRPTDWDAWPAVDAAIKFIARTPCALKIVAVEDALASDVQPNVPGTTVEKPNWRHRLDGDAGSLLDDEAVRQRLAPLRQF